ncbi:PmeII family type II restriction endonuclease [Lactiplantibacillus plantarum]|uniref:PmeII family type II restriction endonuclease n=1 Tax=Lactiplantibacillus plantarum TaxID=1590 RepID=UPI0021F6E016|nr:PmeII family type II restriction endonuclease [Lactiplantibacillus plantarum]MCW0154553.1 PmeII family type II restriction endonuclease [Lactiplantibacillus plantarum]
MVNITEQEVLDNAYDFFFNFFSKVAQNYSKKKYKSFKVNPFTIQATANAFGSPITVQNLAKAVVYPFALGTSIATSFGTNFQAFMVSTTGGVARASVVKGMDIEYDDALDNRHKYCQIKAGPTTINKDDIKTIEDHFKGLTNLARTNHLPLDASDKVVGVLYGTHNDLSTMYRTIEHDGINVFAGEELFYHITGIHGLYQGLIESARRAAENSEMQESIQKLIKEVESGINSHKDLYGLQ